MRREAGLSAGRVVFVSTRMLGLLGLIVLGGCIDGEPRQGLAPSDTEQAIIQLSDVNVDFVGTAGDTAKVSDVIEVRNVGAGELTDIDVGTINFGPNGSGWLSASVEGEAAPAAVQMLATTSTLAPGTYYATVPVTAPNSSNSPQNVVVTLIVPDTAAILVSPDTMVLQAQVGTAGPAVQKVAVLDGAEGALKGLNLTSVSYGQGEPTGWLTASLSGTASPTEVLVQTSGTALSADVYHATVGVISSSSPGDTADVEVELTVTTGPALPIIGVSPTARSFSALVGNSDPGTQSIAITNAGGGALTGLAAGTITFSGGAVDWLDVTIDQTTAPAVLTLQPYSNSLPPGTYIAQIPISATGAANNDRLITATLVVDQTQLIELTTDTVQFGATIGGTSPGVIPVGVLNAGGGTLDGLAVGEVAYGAGQPAGWLSVSLSGSKAPAVITLSVNHGALNPGQYSATIPVSTSLPSVPLASLAVQLSVTGGQGHIVALSGSGQTAYRDSALPNPVVARVYDANGQFAAGQPITWTPGQGGHVTNAQTVTDQNGEVRATWILGSTPGGQGLQVSTPGLPPVSFAAFAAQSPGTNTGEPAGFTIITDRPFNAKIEDNWRDRGDGLFTIVNDASAPHSPSSVGQALLPAGFIGGRGPINTAYVTGQLNYSQIYASFWIKLSPNFVGGQTNGVNKIFHIWINGGSVVVFSAQGQGDNPIKPQMRLQNVEADPRGVSFNLNPNITPQSFIKRGQWHRVDLLLKANTPGVRNGEVTWYLDGTKAGEYKDVGFISSSNPIAGAVNWQQFSWNPTYGGPADTVQADQYIRMDHIYLSGHK